MESLVLSVEFDIPQSSVDDLNTSLSRAVEGGVGSGLQEVNSELEEMGSNAESSSGSVRGLSSITRVLSSDLAKGAAGVTALTRGVGGLKLALGPAVAIIGAITLATRLYKEEQERAADEQERATRISDSLRTSANRLRTAQDELAVATGDLADEEARINRIRLEGFLKTSPAILKAGEDVIAINAEIAKSEQKIADEQARGGTANLVVIAREEEKLGELRAEYNRLDAVRTKLVSDAKALVQTEIQIFEQNERNRKGAKQRAEDEKERADNLAEFGRMQREVASIEASALESGESGSERVLRLQRERLALLQEIAQETHGTIDVTKAEAAVRAETERELFEIRKTSIEELESLAEEAHEKEKARLKEELQVRLSSVNTIGSALGTLSGLAQQAATAQSETDRRAAEQALKTAKRLATAEATVNLASGIVAASARLAGRPVATGIAIAGLLTTYAGQVATIQSQSLHGGGFGNRTFAPDEVRAPDGTTRLNSERSISPTGSRQEEEIRRLERGGGGRGVNVNVTYKHFGRRLRDEVRRNGALGNALRNTGRQIGPGRY